MSRKSGTQPFIQIFPAVHGKRHLRLDWDYFRFPVEAALNVCLWILLAVHGKRNLKFGYDFPCHSGEATFHIPWWVFFAVEKK